MWNVFVILNFGQDKTPVNDNVIEGHSQPILDFDVSGNIEDSKILKISARVGDARLIGPSYYLTASFMRKSHRAQMQMDLLGCKQLCG